MDSVTHGARAAVGCLLVAGAVDVAVIAITGDSISAACRRRPHVTGLVVGLYVLHLAECLGPLDPFRAIGVCAERWRP